jgi:predicted GH43/DUF377 family glycosyl hydrolase
VIKRVLLVLGGALCFYFLAIHRSRELPLSVINEGIEVIDEIYDISLSGYKTYNPGVIALDKGYIMASREKAKSFFDYMKLKCLRKRKNVIVISELDEHFQQIGVSQQVIPNKDLSLKKVTDPRLFTHEGTLYMIFCDHTQGGSVQTLATLKKENDLWKAEKVTPLHFEGSFEFIEKHLVSEGIEKNWMPFSIDGKVYLVYLLEPEKVVVELNILTGNCQLVSRTANGFIDRFAPLRGGSPPLFDEELGEFITVYHVAFPGRNSYSLSKRNIYICGAYTFSKDIPFRITRKTTGPFYQKTLYNNREKIIFATALIQKGDHYLMFYGEDDSRIKVAKIDRKKLLRAMERR